MVEYVSLDLSFFLTLYRLAKEVCVDFATEWWLLQPNLLRQMCYNPCRD